MTQNIAIQFRSRARSGPLNQRFLDVTGPCVLMGYRLQKGTTNFTINLIKDGFLTSAAVTPSGARIEETEDLIDVITITPNSHASIPRKDSIYLVYEYGTTEATATYAVVPGNQGSTTAAPIPNVMTHLLLGYVTVPAGNNPLILESVWSVPYGFSHLDVAGPSHLFGPSTFEADVTFKGNVIFEGGTTGGGGGGGGGTTTQPSRFNRFANPVIATANQKRFYLPTGATYTLGANALFVYVDWVLQPSGMYLEVDSTSFEFYQELSGGEEVFAYWVEDISLYQAAPHNHDDRYYTKSQTDSRAIRWVQDTFAGSTGRTINHTVGSTDFVILGITPTSWTTDVGDISVSKTANTIVVYNTGTYRGSFDLSYILKNPT